MKKSIQKGYLLLFIVFICLPGISYSLLKPFIKSENTENRKLSERPSFENTIYTKFASEYEKYYEDHLPYRNQLITINSAISYFLFKESINSSVIIGKDGWLFLNGDNVIENYKRELVYSEETIEEIKKKYQDISMHYEQEGIRVVFMIIPNKEEIYGDDYLPDDINAQKNNQENRTDTLVSYLREEAGLEVIYPKEEFLKYKDDFQLYFKADTHWNLLGAYIAEQQLLELIYGQRSYLEDENIHKGELTYRISANLDLANMISLRKFLLDDYDYYIEEYPWTDNFESISGINGYSDKVLFIGDSFYASMQPYLYRDFKDCKALVRGYYESSIVEEYEPDVVVIEVVERYAEQLKDFNP